MATVSSFELERSLNDNQMVRVVDQTTYHETAPGQANGRFGHRRDWAKFCRICWYNLMCLHRVQLWVCTMCDGHERDIGACTCY